MSNEIDQPCKNPIENQRAQALKHYEEASSAICHWSGFVENAIKAYNPEQPSPPRLREVIEEMESEILAAKNIFLTSKQHNRTYKFNKLEIFEKFLPRLKSLTDLPLPDETDEIIDSLLNKYDALKNFATGFFYYWWNKKGNNTEEGFQDYIETKEGSEKMKALLKQTPAQDDKQETLWEDLIDTLSESLNEECMSVYDIENARSKYYLSPKPIK